MKRMTVFYWIIIAAVLIALLCRLNMNENKTTFHTSALTKLTESISHVVKRQNILADNINENSLSIGALKLNAATGIIVTVTAYSAEVNQTDSTPHITASNKTVKEGYIALSRDIEKDLGLHFGDLILLEGGIYGIFEFQDRMHKRKKRQVDIFYHSTKEAIEFGVKKATLRVAVKTKEA